MVKILLFNFFFLLFCVAAYAQAEPRTVVGEGAELIMKYGVILDTECGNLDEMQWEFCDSKVKLRENLVEAKGYAGMWECSFHHNYAGHRVNIICLQHYTEY